MCVVSPFDVCQSQYRSKLIRNWCCKDCGISNGNMHVVNCRVRVLRSNREQHSAVDQSVPSPGWARRATPAAGGEQQCQLQSIGTSMTYLLGELILLSRLAHHDVRAIRAEPVEHLVENVLLA